MTMSSLYFDGWITTHTHTHICISIYKIIYWAKPTNQPASQPNNEQSNESTNRPNIQTRYRPIHQQWCATWTDQHIYSSAYTLYTWMYACMCAYVPVWLRSKSSSQTHNYMYVRCQRERFHTLFGLSVYCSFFSCLLSSSTSSSSSNVPSDFFNESLLPSRMKLK